MIDEQGLPQGRKRTRTRQCARLAEGGEDDCGVCGTCKQRASKRRSYHANPEKNREKNRLWRQANPEKIRRWRQANPEKVREKNSRNAAKRGGYIPIADPEMEAQLRAAQSNTCAACLRFVDRLVLDHCHTTGLTRGLLCPPCNKGLGFFRDSPELLLRAVAYLKNPLADKLRKASA